MKMLLTETADIKTLEESQWRITPLNLPVLLIKPPEASVDFIEVAKEEVLPGDVNLVPPASRQNIAMLTHRTLLSESLSKYRDIWRTLAEK